MTDDIAISAGHTVILDADFTSEGSLTILGTLTLGQGAENPATLGWGRVTTWSDYGECVVNLGPGSEINGHGTIGNRCGRFYSTATAENFARIRGAARLFPTATSPASRCQWEMRYLSIDTPGLAVQFFTAGSVDFSGYSAGTHAPRIRFEHCVFRNMNGITFGGSSSTNIDTPFTIDGCDFRDVGLLTMSGPSTGTPAEGALRLFRGNIVSYARAQGPAFRFTMPGAWDLTGTHWINCSAYTSGALPYTYADAFYGNNASKTPVVVSNTNENGSSLTRCVLYNDRDESLAGSNPHLASINKARDCFFDMTGNEGNAHITSAQHTHLETTGCILFGNGDLANSLATTERDWILENNTVAVRAEKNRPVNGLFMAENASFVPGTVGLRSRNNLMTYLGTGAGTMSAFRTVGSNTQLPVDSDYDFTFNLEGHFRGNAVNVNAGGGANGRTGIDPQFGDPTRDCLTWIRHITGNADAGTEELFAFIQAQNGYDEATGIQTAANIPPYSYADMYAWLREGFVPQNAALANAGENGRHIGAMPVSGEDIQEFETTITAYEKYMPGGTSSNSDLNVVPVAVPSGWTVTGVAFQGAHGTLSQAGGAWAYSLTAPCDHSGAGVPGGTAVNADSPTLELENGSGDKGLLTVSVSIVDDDLILSGSSSLSGTASATGSWAANFGVNTPGTVTWTDPNGTTRQLGDTVTLPNWTVTVAANGTITATRTGGEDTLSGNIVIDAENSEGIMASKSVAIRLRGASPIPGPSGAGPLAFSPLSFG